MALFSLSATLLLPPASIAPSNNELIRSLVATCLITHRRLAPWRLWLSANWRTSLTTTMWMVTRVHYRASHRWAATHMTRTSGFTNALIFMIDIADLSDGCHTQDMDIPLLTRRKTQQCIISFFGHQLGSDTSSTHQLTTTTTLH